LSGRSEDVEKAIVQPAEQRAQIPALFEFEGEAGPVLAVNPWI
jgi:hypothetical protein